jgi:Transposase DDE domain
VLMVAHAVAQESLDAYSHQFSPQKFTQHQLFAILTLKEFMRMDYRKVVELMMEAAELRECIGLESVPHFTTVQKASARLLRGDGARALLESTVTMAQKKKMLNKRLKNTAMDSTGMEDRQTSHHFRKRKEESAEKKKGAKKKGKKKTATYPKLSVLCDCVTHLTLSFYADRGPWPDYEYFKPLLDQAAGLASIGRVLCDAGYDSEPNHLHARNEHGTVAIIPATSGRPSVNPPTKKNRRRMKQQWETYKHRYGQRWQVETLFSMLKRMLGSALRAIRHHNRLREMLLRAITLNIIILGAND